MKILICVKQVPDTDTLVKLDSEGKGIQTSSIRWVLNPYDEFALEMALKIKDQKPNTHLAAVSVGPLRVQTALKTALATGVDEACHLEAQEDIDPCLLARALAAAITRTFSPPPDFIFTGKTSIDRGYSATGFMLAECLKWPHAGFVSHVQEGEGGWWLCERKTRTTHRELIHLQPPALVTIDKGSHSLRKPSLKTLMKAKNKPFQTIKWQDLNLPPVSKEEGFFSFELPPAPRAPRILTGPPGSQVQTLLRFLREEEKVI